MRRIKLFSGSETRELADKVALNLGAPLGKMHLEKFSDGEFQPVYDENLRVQTVEFVAKRTVFASESANKYSASDANLLFISDSLIHSCMSSSKET